MDIIEEYFLGKFYPQLESIDMLLGIGISCTVSALSHDGHKKVRFLFLFYSWLKRVVFHIWCLFSSVF